MKRSFVWFSRLPAGQIKSDGKPLEVGFLRGFSYQTHHVIAQCLIRLPPFAPAAETCARMVVESNICTRCAVSHRPAGMAKKCGLQGTGGRSLSWHRALNSKPAKRPEWFASHHHSSSKNNSLDSNESDKENRRNAKFRGEPIRPHRLGFTRDPGKANGVHDIRAVRRHHRVHAAITFAALNVRPGVSL
jgi:hypothetical protein